MPFLPESPRWLLSVRGFSILLISCLTIGQLRQTD